LKLIVLSLVTIAAAACHAETPKTFGVHETIQNIHSLNGRTVRVAGYLGECGGYDCPLFQNKDEWQQAYRYITSARADGKVEPGSNLPDFLGVGGFPNFDAKAQPFTNNYVVITGKVSDVCRDEQLRWGCTDRGPELEPMAIDHWTPESHP
jgi:hypothetical protein